MTQVLRVPRTLYEPSYVMDPYDQTTGFEVGAFYVFVCKQFVGPSIVEDDVQFAALVSVVRAIQPAHQDVLRHVYALQVYTNSEPFAATMAEAGLQMQVVSELGIERTSGADGPSLVGFKVPPGAPAYEGSSIHWQTVAAWSDVQGFYQGQTGTDLSLVVFKMAGDSAYQSGVGMIEFGADSYWSTRSRLSAFGGSTNFEDNLSIEIERRSPSAA